MTNENNDKAVMVRSGGALALNYDDPKLLDVIKQTVAKGATDEELQLFLYHCKSSGLNPLRREVWFIKTGRGPVIMTGINGFYRCANSHSDFNGIDTEIVSENGQILYAQCRVHRKSMTNPISATAYMSEYFKGNSDGWKNYPRRMLEKCAEALALRKAFPQELSNMYEVAEVDTSETIHMNEKIQSVEIKPGYPYRYDLSTIPSDKVASVIEYLNANAARFVAGNIWECDRFLKRLNAYEMREWWKTSEQTTTNQAS